VRRDPPTGAALPNRLCTRGGSLKSSNPSILASSNPHILRSSDPRILTSSNPQILKSSHPQISIADVRSEPCSRWQGGNRYEDPNVCEGRPNPVGHLAYFLIRKEVSVMKVRTTVKAGTIMWGDVK
jgi:hypothetical protein